MDILGSSTSTGFVNKYAITEKEPVSVEKAKIRMEFSPVAPAVNAQVLQAKSAITPEKLREYLDDSKFNESEKQVVDHLRFAVVAMEEKDRSGGRGDSLSDWSSFDPRAWEKHVGVLMAAIVSVNIARKSSAAMSGLFTQMAYQASVAQGEAIVAGGEAAMWASVSGATVASAMSLGGAALSIRGQNQKHTDIKTNRADAAKYAAAADEIRVKLEMRPTNKFSGSSSEVRGTNANGESEVIVLDTGRATLDSRDRVVLEAELRSKQAKSKEASMASELQEKTYSNNITVGGAMSSMAMILSAGLTSILRLAEYAERQHETLRQADHNVHKAVSDAQSQEMNEATALIRKFLEAIQQLVDTRSATMGAIASRA